MNIKYYKYPWVYGKIGRKYGENIVRPVSEAEGRAYGRLPETDRLACTAAFGRYIDILKEEIYGTEN